MSGRGRGSIRGNVTEGSAGRPTRSLNLNAEPVALPTDDPSPCGVCNVSAGLDGIGCDECIKWFHPTSQCTGLKTNTITCIQDEGGEGIYRHASGCTPMLSFNY